MRTEEEIKKFLEEITKEPSLTPEQYQTIGRTLRWVLGLEDKVILPSDGQ